MPDANYDRWLASLEDRAMLDEDDRDLDTDAERERENAEDLKREQGED